MLRTEPLVSGHEWVVDKPNSAPSEHGLAPKEWLMSKTDPKVRAMAKWPHDPGAEYSVGMERVAYRVGSGLGLPIPATYLEDYKGQPASVQLRVRNPKEFDQAQASPGLWGGLSDRDIWPMCVAFDVWFANLDRRPPNILIEPIPPEKLAHRATAGRTRLIDHGLTGLWYPQKVDPSLGKHYVSVDRLTLRQVRDGVITDEACDRIRRVMPIEYRRSFSARGRERRQPCLDRIRDFPDDLLEAAVQEVPDRYFSEHAAELTLAFLRARQSGIYTLTEGVFPST